MTGSSEKMRALVLSALMVLSVFAGTIALSGAATAQAANSDVASVTEYGGTIEVALEGTTSSNIDGSNVQVYVDGVSQGIGAGAVSGDTTTGPARITIAAGTDLDPTSDVTVTIDDEGTSGVSVDNESVTVTGAVLQESTANGSTQEYFRGTQVAFHANNNGTSSILELNQGSDTIRQRGTGENSEVYVIDTSGQSLSTPYHVSVDGGGTSSYTLDDLGLSASLDSNSINEGSSVEASAEMDVINRDVEFRLINSDGDIENEKTTSVGSNGQASVSFSPEPGNYSITAVDTQSGVSANAGDVSVADVADANVAFGSTVVNQERGDVMNITVDYIGNANTADLEIGNDDIGFFANLTVTDGDGDGQAVVRWNTYKPNNSTYGLWAHGEDDTISLADPANDTQLNRPPEAGEYPASVQIRGMSSTEDVATLVVEDRSTTSVTTHTAPGALDITNQNVSTLSAAASSAEVGNTVALDDDGRDDWSIVRIESSGLAGYMDSASAFSGTNGVSVSITEDESTVGTNKNPIAVTDYSSLNLLSNPSGDTYYLAIETSDLNRTGDLQAGDQFNVRFHVESDNSNVTNEDETVTTSFTYEAGSVSVDTQGDTLFVPADENAQVTGESNFAPGTDLTVTLRSTGGQSPFSVQNNSVNVAPDGTWDATFDLSDKADGQQFTATVRKAGANRVEVDGRIGELNAQVTFSDQQAQDSGTLVTVDSATLSDGGYVVIHQGGPGGPVVGATSYLEGDTTHTDVNIRLQEAVSQETTLVAMAHKDTDGDRTFDWVASDGEDDAPYTSGGEPVTDPAAVSLQTPTPTDTPSPEPETDTPEPETDTPEPETDTPEPDTPSPTPTSTPGFGLIVALLALAGAALLALRRD